MKKTYLYIIILALFTAIFTGCNDEKDFVAKELKLSTYDVTLETKTEQQVEVLSGNGSYKAEVSNDNINVKFIEKKLHITGVKGGNSTIKVTDAQGQKATIEVTITLPKTLKLSINELILEKGSQEEIIIVEGNGGYKIEVSNKNIKAVIKDNKILTEALKKGASIITVTDAKGNKAIVKVEVSLPKELKLSTSELSIMKGGQETIKILDGNGTYKLTVSNSNVKATLKDREINVKALKKGVSIVKITDAKGQEISVKVSVYLPKSLKLSTSELNLIKGGEGKVKILDGNGLYQIKASNNNIKITFKNNEINVQAVNKGSAIINITDAKGEKASVKVEVFSPKDLKLSETEVKLKKGDTKKIKILAGNGDYKVSGANNKVKVELKNDEVHVTGLLAGTSTITVTDAKGKKASIKVIVSLSKVLKLNTKNLSLEKGDGAQIKIIDGNGGYKVTTSNTNAKAEFKNGEIYVTALQAGTSTITVTDAKDKKASVKVIISLTKILKLSVNDLVLEKGDKAQVKIINGNGGYKVTTSNTNAKAEFKNGQVYVTALQEGTSTITVTDSKDKEASVQVKISLQKELKLSTAKLTLLKGAKEQVEIIDGNGGYKVTSTTNVKAEIIAGVINLTALKKGTSTIKVTDAKDKTAYITVVVDLPKELKLSVNKLTLEKDSQGQIKIVDGNGGYSATSTNKAEAIIIANVIYITALEKGTSTITVTDAKGKTASVEIKVTSPKDISLSTANLTLEKGNQGQVKILDGNGGYRINTSNNKIQAILNNGIINVTALEQGTATIKVTDVKGKTATLNVKVTVKSAPKALDIIHKIKVVIYQGHLHGKSFHGNPINASPLRIHQYFILEKNNNGNWVRVNNNDIDYVNEGDPVVKLGYDVGSKAWSFHHGYEFIYYDKEGNRLEDKIFNDSDVYQTLFSVEAYKELETNNTVKLNSTKDFFDYEYRDTNPANKIYKKGVVGMSNNYLGLKGYMLVNKNRVSYTLKVNFVKFKNSGAKVNSIYLEDANTSEIKDQISFEIPVVIPAGRSAGDEYDVFAKYFNLTVDEYQTLLWNVSGGAHSSQYWM